MSVSFLLLQSITSECLQKGQINSDLYILTKTRFYLGDGTQKFGVAHMKYLFPLNHVFRYLLRSSDVAKCQSNGTKSIALMSFPHFSLRAFFFNLSKNLISPRAVSTDIFLSYPLWIHIRKYNDD